MYTLAIAKYICVQLKDVQAPIRVEADTLEKGSQVFTLKKGQDTVGELGPNVVMAWWVENTGEPGIM